nr:MAG: hypothetical protein B6I27_02305 [Erwiniaceae bacterium 4572_131]
MDNFTYFKERKQNLINSTDELRTIVHKQLDDRDIEMLDAFSQELQKELSFNVLCVGDFSSGKTTFINKFLIKDDILPASARPTTTRLTEVRYGEKLQAHVINNDGNISNILGNVKDSLADYVASEGSNIDTTDRVIVEVPSPVLKDGIVVIDAPGLNDPDLARMKITLDYLHQADAILYFFNAQQAWTKSQKEFLEDSILHKKDFDKLFLILNYWDCVDEEEREDVLEYVNVQIDKSMSLITQKTDIDNNSENLPLNPELLPISAKTGENLELVQNTIWNYLSESKDQNVLSFKIQRFNTYIDNYIAILNERIELEEEDTNAIKEKKEKIKLELKEYKKKTEIFMVNIKKKLSITFDDFEEGIKPLFDSYMQDLQSKIGKYSEKINSQDSKQINRKIGSILSDGENKLKVKEKNIERKFLKQFINVIEEQKAEIDVPLSKITSLEDYFSKWKLNIDDTQSSDTAISMAQTGAGIVALGGATTTLSAGVFAMTIGTPAFAATGLFSSLGGLLFGSEAAAIAATSATIAGATAVTGGIALVVGVAGFVLLKQLNNNKKNEQIDNLLESLESKIETEKEEFISSFNKLRDQLLPYMLKNIDNDIMRVYKQKQEELNDISENKEAIHKMDELKQKLINMKMQVN